MPHDVIDIFAEQESYWKNLWNMDDAQWRAVWRYFRALAALGGLEFEDVEEKTDIRETGH